MHFPPSDYAQAFLQSMGMGLGLLAPVHPTQLYEMFGTMASMILVLNLGKLLNLKERGRFGMFAAMFSMAGLIILLPRALSYSERIVHRVYPLIYLILIAAGMEIFLLRGKPDIYQNKSTEQET